MARVVPGVKHLPKGRSVGEAAERCQMEGVPSPARGPLQIGGFVAKNGKVFNPFIVPDFDHFLKLCRAHTFGFVE